MREQWARRIVIITGLLVLLLAIAFAVIQNPKEVPDTTASSEQALPPPERPESNILDPERIEAGRQIYTQQTCARCHSITGEGNPRNPLDGVGARRSAEELRNWITGAHALQGVLPESAFKLKQAYGKLPDGELDALVAYMQSLRL